MTPLRRVFSLLSERSDRKGAEPVASPSSVAKQSDARSSRSARLLGARWVAPAIAGLAAIVVVVAGRDGVGVSPDSVVYASAARSFADTGQLMMFSGERLTTWPPGLPVILGAVLLAGVPLAAAVLALNVICLVLSVLLTHRLAGLLANSAWVAVGSASAFAFSWATVRVHARLWSEPLFTTLTLIVLVWLVEGLRTRSRSWGALVVLGVSVSLATAVRFTGFALIPLVILGVLLALWRSEGRRNALLKAAFAGGLASVGLIVVAVRNLSYGAAPLGDREASGIAPMTVAVDSLEALGRYLLPLTNGAITVAAGALLLVGFALAAVVAIRRLDPTRLVLWIFVGGWWVLLLYSQFATIIDPVNERLLAPAFPVMVVLAFDAAARFSAGRSLIWSAAAMAVVLGLTAFFGARQAINAPEQLGYAQPARMNSELARMAAALPSEAGLASNDAGQL